MRKLLLVCVFLSACTPSTSQNTDAPIHPYHTSAPSQTTTPNVLPPDTPIPTNTMQIYIVEAGDTLSEIAEKFRIPQADLIAANPDVNPNALPIGATLFIPDPSSTQAAASSLTPIPVPITQAVCHPTAESGLWCFALIQNNTAELLENVSVKIILHDANDIAISSETAFPPLDAIQPNSSLPVYVFFPDAPADAKPQVQLLSAIQSNGSGYLPAFMDNTSAQVDWNGKYAIVGGEIHLPAESNPAKQVWVAAVAYDKNGTVIGLRRWEGGVLQPGGSIRFDFGVSSLGGEIDAVEFSVQAR